MNIVNRRSGLVALTLTTSLLAGCEVGPDYGGPPNAAPRAASALGFHRATQPTLVPTPPLAIWWTALGDPALEQLETLAIQKSPTLEAAEASVRAARAAAHERETALLPTGGANALYLRTRLPDPLSGSIPALSGIGATASPSLAGSAPSSSGEALKLYSTALDATWQLDIFGGTRRQIEAASASADASQAELEDAQVTLTVDLALAYVNLRDSQHRLGLTEANVATEQRMVDLERQRRVGGTVSDLDVERLVTQLDQTRSQIPTLAADVEIYSDQIADLAGLEPGALDSMLAEPKPVPLPPASTPIGDPATMIRHRPDIRAAERGIAASNALIGVSIAQYFPQVTLLGSIGYSASQSKDLFKGKSLTYLGGPSISWNIFSAPQIGAEVAASKATTDAARAFYRKTVLAALADAENALSRFGHQCDDVAILEETDASARRSADLSNQQFSSGTSSLTDTLSVESNRLQTEASLAQGQAELTSDWISLQSSLGLGWDTPQQMAGR